MDREMSLIEMMSELTKIVSGIQDTIKAQTDCITLLKGRVENLEELR